MTILQILNELAAEPSTNAREAILEREKDNALLKRVFQAAYNPMITYGLKQIPEYTPCQDVFPGSNLSWALDRLNVLATRELTGHAAIEHLTTILEDLSEDSAVVLERIIGRDLRCNTSDSLATRIWPGLVPTFDVMLSHKDCSGIKFPAICQIKSDGMRVHAYFDGKTLELFTRSGKTVKTHGVLDATAAKFMKAGETFDGELVCYKNGVALDRKASNGIGNKGVKGTVSREEAEMYRLLVWDNVDFTSTIKYCDRFDTLMGRFDSVVLSDNEKFIPIPSVVVNSMDDAEARFQDALDAGEEGVILKNINAVWQPKRTKDLGKMKAEEEADLVVVGCNEGTGKYAGQMGSLVCETSDGLLNVNVSGWSDNDRATLTEKNTKGKILTVMYNAIIDSRGRATKSLFLPRAVEFRSDKTVANTLAELK